MKKLDQCNLVIFDSDGVLVEEGKPIPGAKELVNNLKERNKSCIVFSNNSTTHPREMLHRYQEQDIHVDEVINSGLLAAEYLKKENIQSVYIVGEQGLVDIVREHGITVTNTNVDVVLVGMDRTLTYEKLAIATRLIRKGARFIATNPDKSFPTPRGLEPGAGSMIAALVASTDSDPEVIVGKPATFGFDYILDKSHISGEQVIMIGDRYETDIIGAIEANIDAIVVNTGVAKTRNTPNRWQDYPEVPLVGSLYDLIVG